MTNQVELAAISPSGNGFHDCLHSALMEWGSTWLEYPVTASVILTLFYL